MGQKPDWSGDTISTLPFHPGEVGAGRSLMYGDDLEAGARVSGYVVEQLRGRGGFATVYRARHRVLERPVALKVLHRCLVTSPSMLGRFKQEARAISKIGHANIVQIHDFGELQDGRPYIVLEWLDGRNLDEHLSAHGPLSANDALGLLENVGSALHAAHEAGIIHRDIKASNVMLLADDGTFPCKLVDFGVAKMLEDPTLGPGFTATGMRMGSPATMAPEQVRAEPIDRRVDIYALGILMFQVVTGRLPFESRSALELQELHLTATPPRACDLAPVPRAFDDVIQRCLEKQPDRRHATVQGVLEDLRRSLGPVL